MLTMSVPFYLVLLTLLPTVTVGQETQGMDVFSVQLLIYGFIYSEIVTKSSSLSFCATYSYCVTERVT